jgi:2-polyprenyl-3-methyl-5-hydroxy-6-metoxy-1,4-benzoquinol methylase
VGYDDRYDPDTDFDRWYTRGTGDAIAAWIRPGDAVLELGCATGLMTARLADAGASVVAVDRSAAYLDRARGRGLPDVTFVEADIGTLDLGRTFAHVVAANVAHEVPNLDAFLGVCRAHMARDGLLHVSLQNPQSIHRLVGLEMGVVASVRDVSARGREFETLRLLEASELADAGRRAGLRCVHRGGVMLKPLPNDLMATLPEPLLEGFLGAARHLPDHAAMNYLVFIAET